MLEVEPQPLVSVADTVMKQSHSAFPRWLHHRYVPIKLPSATAYCLAIQYLVLLVMSVMVR